MKCDKERGRSLDEELLNLILDGLNLSLQLGSFIRRYRAGNNSPVDSTGPAKGCSRGHKDVGDSLVLAEEREVEENLNGLSVGSHDNEFGDTAIEGLGCCIIHRRSDKDRIASLIR
jgi:hypothetical protein